MKAENKSWQKDYVFDLALLSFFISSVWPSLAFDHETSALTLTDEFIPVKIYQELSFIDQIKFPFEFFLCDNSMAWKSQLCLMAEQEMKLRNNKVT